MSIGKAIVADVEAAAVNAVPGGLAVRFWLYFAAILVAASLIGFAWWWIFIHPGQLQRQVAQGHVDTTMAQAGTLNANDALRIKGEVDSHKLTIDVITKGNQDAILSAHGADQAVDPAVGLALAHALCLRDAYRSDGDRAGLCPAGAGIGPARSDPGSGAAGGDRGADGAPDAH